MNHIMTDRQVFIRKVGRAGHITLNRPKALNALTGEMVFDIDRAMDAWCDDTEVELIILDAFGGKAFCAGGDIAELYKHGTVGRYEFGRDFWRSEYRLNLKIATYAKPVIAFMHGFVMGGGVGLSAHASHRIVCENSRISMPECGIGLIPDVGGTFLLGCAPVECGVYLGLTGTAMDARDAIFAGFADCFVPEAKWQSLKDGLIHEADLSAITNATQPAPGGNLDAHKAEIHEVFTSGTVPEIAKILSYGTSEFARAAAKKLSRGSPLSLACTLQAIREARSGDLADALKREFRFVYRSQEKGDFNEGIRAQIIDKDFAPNWRHDSLDVPISDVAEMLGDLGKHEWTPNGATL